MPTNPTHPPARPADRDRVQRDFENPWLKRYQDQQRRGRPNR